MMNKYFSLLVVIGIFLTGNILRAEIPDKSSPSLIREAPPAPKFSDAERQAELGRRRAEVAKSMLPNSILIMRSAEPRNYAGDVDFMYRQENNFYYLTSLKQAGSMFVLIKDGENVRELLYLPKRNPSMETWNGRMYSMEEAF